MLKQGAKSDREKMAEAGSIKAQLPKEGAKMQKPMSSLAFNFMRIIMNIRKFFRDFDKEIAFAEPKKGDKVVDFGCGLGFNTIPLAKLIGAGGKVFAVDISPKAVGIVKKKLKKHKLTNTECMLSGSIAEIEKSSIDVVYLHNTLPLIKDKQKALNEIDTVLKKGGRLSYMSRLGSRVYGDDNLSNQQLKEILCSEYHFKLIKDVKEHFVFLKELD